MKIWFLALALAVLIPAPAIAQQRYVPSTKNPSGPEIVAVFLTAEFCIGSRQPHMPATIERMKMLLAERSAQAGEGLSIVGVSLDWRTQEGVDHLAKFGAFDEIVVGRNWFGTGAIHFVWRDLAGQPTTPQILLLRRQITVEERGVSATAERQVRRIVGADAIKEWVDSGAPVEN
jgi:hypothetical protein